jgi:hypothetical protein
MLFFHLFTIHSAHVSALVIVLSDSPCERIRKWETCLILKEVGARLAETSVTSATLLGVSRVTVSKVMLAYTNHGRQYQRRGTVGENQH